jgi:hypothetical protein
VPSRSELECFCRCCRRHLRLEDGRPLAVEGFQKRMLADYFAGTTETIVLCPKKQRKSTITASVALFHLVTTPDAECVIVAASREQAGILFGQAAGFVLPAATEPRSRPAPPSWPVGQRWANDARIRRPEATGYTAWPCGTSHSEAMWASCGSSSTRRSTSL